MLSAIMISTYFDQLEREAREAGVALERACEAAGVALTTLQRWRKGEVTPREATAKAISEQIQELRAPSEAA